MDAKSRTVLAELTLDQIRTLSDVGGIAISEAAAARILDLLNRYANSKTFGSRAMRERRMDEARRCVKNIDTLIESLNAFIAGASNPSAAASTIESGLGPTSRVIEHLRLCRENIAASHQSEKPGRPTDHSTNELLENLAQLSREAGVNPVVARTAIGRPQSFIQFCWQATCLLPEHLRPKSAKALQARWERLPGRTRRVRGSAPARSTANADQEIVHFADGAAPLVPQDTQLPTTSSVDD